MLSVDTNLLLYAAVAECPEQGASEKFLRSLESRTDVAISEFVLVELYTLLRNPAVVKAPLGSSAAVQFVQTYRRHPKWRVVSFPAPGSSVMEDVWREASAYGFARLRIYDTRLALTLRHHGVTEFATRNVKDFQGFGFKRVFDPLA